MAFSTTTILGLKKPDIANSVDTWGEELNDSLDILDAHNHTEDAANAITPAAMNINAALSFGGNNLTSLGILGFAQVAASAVGGSLWRRTSDNELIWRTAAGVDVQLTSGTSINASLLEGINGDYATSSASVTYSNTTKIYKFLQNTGPDHWAALDIGELSIYEQASGITNAVKLKSPATLASAYTLTLLAALPAETRRLTVSSTGVLGTIDPAGKQIPVPLGLAVQVVNANQYAYQISSTGAGAWSFELPITGLRPGMVITAARCFIEVNIGADTVTVALKKKERSTSQTTLGSNTGSTADAEIAVTGLSETVDANATYYLDVSATATSSLIATWAAVDITDIP